MALALPAHVFTCTCSKSFPKIPSNGRAYIHMSELILTPWFMAKDLKVYLSTSGVRLTAPRFRSPKELAKFPEG